MWKWETEDGRIVEMPDETPPPYTEEGRRAYREYQEQSGKAFEQMKAEGVKV